MQQVTWRAADELVEQVRSVAAHSGQSMNEFLTRVLQAVTDPELSGSEAERVRERLARAGLLAPPGSVRTRPPADAVARARKAAGAGTPLADIVSRDRG